MATKLVKAPTIKQDAQNTAKLPSSFAHDATFMSNFRKLFGPETQGLVADLINAGQEHLFDDWEPAGSSDDVMKKYLAVQLKRLNKTYPGGLVAYINRVRCARAWVRGGRAAPRARAAATGGGAAVTPARQMRPPTRAWLLALGRRAARRAWPCDVACAQVAGGACASRAADTRHSPRRRSHLPARPPARPPNLPRALIPPFRLR